MSYLNPGKVPRGPSAVTGSFVCKTFDCSGDITRHKKCCDGQLPPPKQSEFQKVISLGTSVIVPAEVVSLVQFFRSRTLLFSSDRLKVCVCVFSVVSMCGVVYSMYALS